MKLSAYFSSLVPKGTTISNEARAGFTTFLTMAYILFVNPSILAGAMSGIDRPQLVAATALCAAFGSILMGLLSRYPFAMAPGMGLNAYFAYTLVGSHGLSWQSALACVFVSGILFLVLSVSGLRRVLVEAIPSSLKYAMGGGIGLFLAFIGLANAGIVIKHPATIVGMGPLVSAGPLICLGSVIVTTYGLIRGWSFSLLLGIGFGTAAAILTDAPVFNGASFSGFEQGIFAWPVWPSDLIGAMDLGSLWQWSLVAPIVLLLFVDFFDTAGTLYGLAGRAGYLDSNHQLPRSNRAFLADAIATMFSGIIGSSPTTTYIESAAGVESGGKGGLVAVFVGLFFLIAMFFWPLVGAVPAAATASALIVVGAMMASSMTKIEWSDPLHSIPAFLTIVMMPLTYSISNGIAVGIMTYGALSFATLKFNRSNLIMQILSILLALRFFWWD